MNLKVEYLFALCFLVQSPSQAFAQVTSSWYEDDGYNETYSSLTKHIPKANTVVTFGVRPDENLNLTMQDIINDTELLPLIFPPLEWKVVKFCIMKGISVSQSHITINNNIKIAISHESGEGLLLTAINPDTCDLTYQNLFLTNEFGVYRGLISVVEKLQPGRIIILLSQSEGSFLLHDSARRILSDAGSQFVDHYLYGDAWVWIFVKDGSSLGEALIPNLGTKDNFNSLPSLEIKWLWSSQKSLSIPDCSNWPQNDLWIARRTFCRIHDALGRLCDCLAPLQFHSPKLKNTSQQRIPILILCGSRVRAVLSLLESLSIQKSLNKAVITLVLDGNSQITRQLAFILGLRVIIHRPVGYKGIRISRNLRFGLFNALKIFPKSEAFIILEDDLLVSPDFYSYMTQLSPVFKLDPTIYCVSGFNFLSSPETSSDPTLTYRTDGYPGLGWMMPRSTIVELLPKWPHKTFYHDWDYLLAMNIFRKERQCVIPDVNRVYHNCVQDKGMHVNPSWFSERLFLRKGLNNISEVVLQPNDRLIKANYEEEMRHLVSLATPIEITDVYNITLPRSQNGIYVIFAKMKFDSDYEAFRLVADSLGTWIGPPDFHRYNYTWRLFIQECPLLVVGIPFSYYTSYMPKSAPVYSVPEYATKHLLSEELEKEKVPVITHRNFHSNDWVSAKLNPALKSSTIKFTVRNYSFAFDNFTDLRSIFSL